MFLLMTMKRHPIVTVCRLWRAPSLSSDTAGRSCFSSLVLWKVCTPGMFLFGVKQQASYVFKRRHIFLARASPLEAASVLIVNESRSCLLPQSSLTHGSWCSLHALCHWPLSPRDLQCIQLCSVFWKGCRFKGKTSILQWIFIMAQIQCTWSTK